MDNTLTALILSAMLMFTATTYQNTPQAPQASQPAASAAAESQRATVKLITTIRKVPNPMGLPLGQLNEGTIVEITDSTSILGVTWARVDTGAVIGWIPLELLEVKEETHFVTIQKLSRLSTAPSDRSNTLALLKEGDELLVLRAEKISGVEWLYVHSARLSAYGWIRAAVVDMTGVTPLEPTPAPTEPTTVAATIPPVIVTSPVVQEPTVSYVRMGVVTSNTLNIRTGPSVNYARIGEYRYGDRVGFLETRDGWGRTNAGWIYLGYVYLDGDVGAHPMLGAVTASALHVRSGPGTGYSVVCDLARDRVVVILQQIQVGRTAWGCTKLGWVCMDYIVPETLPEPTIPICAYGFVNSSNLNVRIGPGTGYGIVGAYKYGDLISIIEVTDVNGIQWGRTERGWVCMSYVSILKTFDPPAEPETTPTEPETTPTEPETTPTEPETTPTEPETTPTEPETTPTEPETTPTEPETTPTEPETPPSEPETTPAEPETEPEGPETSPSDEGTGE